jgi:hypothetical protein
MKNKNMKGGIFGLIPNQPKYYKETATNETFNELYTKLIRNEGNLIKENSSFYNKVKAKTTSFFNKKRFEQRFHHFLEILKYRLEHSNDSTYPALREKYLEIRRKYIDKFREIESLNRNGDDLNTLNLAIIDLIMRKEKTIKNTNRNIKNIQDLRQFSLLCINDYIDFIVSFYSIVLQNSRNELNLIRKILLNLFNEENFMKLIDSILRKNNRIIAPEIEQIFKEWFKLVKKENYKISEISFRDFTNNSQLEQITNETYESFIGKGEQLFAQILKLHLSGTIHTNINHNLNINNSVLKKSRSPKKLQNMAVIVNNASKPKISIGVDQNFLELINLFFTNLFLILSLIRQSNPRVPA